MGFLKENDAKRARAIKKSAEEQELCKKKEMEVQKLEDLQQQLVEERERLSENWKSTKFIKNLCKKFLTNQKSSQKPEKLLIDTTLWLRHIQICSIESSLIRKHQKMRKHGWYDLLKKKITKYFTTIISLHNYKHVWIRHSPMQ